jgi:Cys-tRNA(Pro)/Cys-tRNA(Cys) deacylase
MTAPRLHHDRTTKRTRGRPRRRNRCPAADVVAAPLDPASSSWHAATVSLKSTQPKTNACRVLDALGIGYALRAYDVDEDDLSATTVAQKVGLPAEQVYKTLCLRADDRSILLALVAADRELDFKLCARVAGQRSVEPVAVKELVALTGYIRGGVTALACKKAYPVVVDDLFEVCGDVVSVSAGQRGLQILIAPADYLRAVGAAGTVTVGAISRAPTEEQR